MLNLMQLAIAYMTCDGGPQAQASPTSLHCVLEHDTLMLA